MPMNVVVFDRRTGIAGVPTVPVSLPQSEVIFADEWTPLDRLVGDIFTVARANGGIGVLRLMCKAVASHVYAPDPLNGKMEYWLGLQLAAPPGLHPEPTSYSTFAPLHNKIRSIVVHAGNPSFGYSNIGPRGNAPIAGGGGGRLLMQALADTTRAEVIAPDTQQSAQSLGTAWDLYKGRPWVLDFGGWEGQLWRYTPGGKRPIRHDV